MAVVVTFSGNEERLIRSQDRIAKKAGQMAAGFKGTQRAAADFENTANKALRGAVPATERYNSALAVLRRRLDQGLISQRQFNLASQRLRTTFSELSTLSRGLRGIFAGGAALLGGATAIGAVNRLYQDHLAILGQVAQRVDVLAAGQARVLSNLGLQVTGAQRSSFLNQLQNLSTDVGINTPTFNRAAAETFSATSGSFADRRRQTVELLEQTAPFFRTIPEELGQFAGAVFDFSRSIRDRESGEDAPIRTSLALLLQAQSQARIVGIENLKTISQAVAGVTATTRGDQIENAKAAIATFGALGARLGDPTGELTKTAVVNLSAVLREFFPKLDTFGDRLLAAQTVDEGFRQQIVESLLGRGVTKPVAEELVRGIGDAAATFKEIAANLVILPEKLAQLQQDLTRGRPELALRTFTERTSTIADQLARVTGKQIEAVLVDALFTGEEAAIPKLPLRLRGGTRFGFVARQAAGATPFQAALGVLSEIRGRIQLGGVQPDERRALDGINALTDAVLQLREDLRSPELKEAFGETITRFSPPDTEFGLATFRELEKVNLNLLQGRAEQAQQRNAEFGPPLPDTQASGE